MSRPPSDLDKFLRELNKLTLKHGIVIGSCGCCSSPWAATPAGSILAERLTWDAGDAKYVYRKP